MRNELRLFLLATVIYLYCCPPALAQTTAFIYQGRLTDGGTVASGNYDLQFALWDNLVNGSQVGSTQTLNTVAVSNGVFTVTLDFGANVFSGASRFLEISARPSGTGTFTLLSPRQQITSTPYAVRSLNAASADSIPASGVPSGSGNYIQNTTTPQSASNFNISGSGTIGDNLNVGSTVTGNIVNAGTQFSIGGTRIISAPFGSFNMIVGWGAGHPATGQKNSFFGAIAGSSNTLGNSNSFFGTFAGQNNAGGSYNSFFGANSGQANNGEQNAFYGTNSGRQNASGNYNSFFGGASTDLNQGTGYWNTIGNFNSFFGHRAGENNDGNLNSFFGTGAGFLNTFGNSNTLLGHDAGNTNTVGSYNTVIGDNADVSANNLTNATAIGANALVSQSNSLVLGSINGTNGATEDTRVGIGTTAPNGNLHVNVPSSPNPIRALTVDVQSFQTTNNAVASYYLNVRDVGSGNPPAFFIRGDGNVGVGTGAPNDRLDVNGFIRVSMLSSAGSTQLCLNSSGQISVCSSSLRYKNNIAPFLSGLSFIKELQPITFEWKQGGLKDVGFGAEDIARVNSLFVTYNSEGAVEGVKYDRFSAVFVNAFKEQQAQIEHLQSELEQQRALLKQQQSQIDSMKKLICLDHSNADVCRVP